MRCSEVKCHGRPAGKGSGGNDLGGKQIWRPEHQGMTAAPKLFPCGSRCTEVAERRPGTALGKADALGEETGSAPKGCRGIGPGTERRIREA